VASIGTREKAQSLRRNGWGIKEISLKLSASQSSVSSWCRDIPLTSEQIDRLVRKSKTEGLKALLRHAEKARRIRVEKVEEQMEAGRKDVRRLSKRDLFIAGLALYWGEGYKKGNEEFGFTNSDFRVLRFMMRWLTEIYAIAKGDYIFRISMNQIYENYLPDVTNKWSKLLGVPKTQFTMPSIIKVRNKKIYSEIGSYLGTLRIKVRRGTNLRRRILGSIEALASFC